MGIQIFIYLIFRNLCFLVCFIGEVNRCYSDEICVKLESVMNRKILYIIIPITLLFLGIGLIASQLFLGDQYGEVSRDVKGSKKSFNKCGCGYR